jgi:uncharacterized OB-fold protein
MSQERDYVEPFNRRVDFPYWEGLGVGELRIQRCLQCAGWRWPADWRCPECGGYELGWEAVAPHGVIYSWIRTHMPFVRAYSDLVPYVNVLVELPHAGGARLIGLLTGSESGLRIGAGVKGDFQPASPRTTELPVVTWSLEASES